MIGRARSIAADALGVQPNVLKLLVNVAGPHDVVVRIEYFNESCTEHRVRVADNEFCAVLDGDDVVAIIKVEF